MTNQAKSVPEASFLDGYAKLPRALDEFVDEHGVFHPHVARFIEALNRLSRAEFDHRWEGALRQIRENGVTYNVYGDDQGTERPWQLDPLPLLMTEEDWARLEHGLAQRAHLLNLILQDIYGPQSLLRSRILPPEIVVANPAFLRPVYGTLRPRARHLHIYAADVARGPQGEFWVVGDRTQAPSGMGYALENRMVLSRALSRVYRDCRVHKLAPFFQRNLELIRDLSPRKRENPHAVLLSPGPLNETYFEHSYLARYLGLTLVSGGDLTVRNDVVYLKTLGGLDRVDVIMRRVDDEYCDPLALRGDSTLGVSGLVGAVQAGNVAVVNSLGSGITESRALLPFLASISRHLLGEDLILPSAATYWCGQQGALSHVLANLDALLIKPAFTGNFPKPDPILPATLSRDKREELIRRLKAEPHAYVGQERLHLPTAPTYREGKVQPGHVATRAYLVARGSGYHAMSGGLTRVATDLEFPVLSMQRGAGSKDTWILAEGRIAETTLLLNQQEQLALSRAGDDLPSRVADHMFWLGRYMERAENTVRLCRSLLNRVVVASSVAATEEVRGLRDALHHHTKGDFDEPYQPGEEGVAQLEQGLIDFIANSTGVHGLNSMLSAAHQNASAVRDRISVDAFRATSLLLSDYRRLARQQKLTSADVLLKLDRLIISFASISGMSGESLSRTLGYRFLLMGRRLERAATITRLLQSTLCVVGSDESSMLWALLEICDNSMTYRRRYQGLVQLGPVLDLLLTDEINPRSVAYQMVELHEHIRHLPRSSGRPFRSPDERTVLRTLTRLRLLDIPELCEVDDKGLRAGLIQCLSEIGTALPVLSNILTLAYLSHAQPQAQRR